MQSLENAYYKELFANQFYKVSLYTNTIYSSVIWTCKNCPIDFKLGMIISYFKLHDFEYLMHKYTIFVIRLFNLYNVLNFAFMNVFKT